MRERLCARANKQDFELRFSDTRHDSSVALQYSTTVEGFCFTFYGDKRYILLNVELIRVFELLPFLSVLKFAFLMFSRLLWLPEAAGNPYHLRKALDLAQKIKWCV